jgi:hypothetical protein
LASSAGQEKRKTRLPYMQQKFASQDKRFQAALAEADALYSIHHGDRGAEFEEGVRSVLGRFLPYTYHVHGGFMSPIGGPKDGLKKQLDIIIRSRLLPELMHAVPVELITVAGEVKTTFSGDSKKDYLATAQTLVSGAARAGRRRPLPFFALAGALDRAESGHASWLASVVSDAANAALDGPGLWPAFFSFDERSSMSAIPVGPLAPLSAVTVEGEELVGVISIAAEHLSVSAVCYLWLWACLYSFEDAPGMEMRYMRDALYSELTDGRGLRAAYWPLSGDGDPQAVTVPCCSPVKRARTPPGQILTSGLCPAAVSQAANWRPDRWTSRPPGSRAAAVLSLSPWAVGWRKPTLGTSPSGAVVALPADVAAAITRA